MTEKSANRDQEKNQALTTVKISRPDKRWFDREVMRLIEELGRDVTQPEMMKRLIAGYQAMFSAADTTESRNSVASQNLGENTKGFPGTMFSSKSSKGRQLSGLEQVFVSQPLMLDILISSLSSALEILTHTRVKGGPDDRTVKATIELLKGIKKGA